MVASYFGSGSVFIMSTAGVGYGYGLIWVAAGAVFMGVMAQDMAARVGIIGDSLGTFTRRKLGTLPATLIAVFISIGAVLWGLELTAAVGLGMSILIEGAIGIHIGWMPIAVLTGIVALVNGLFDYETIEYIMTAMLVMLFLAFSAVAVIGDPNWVGVASGFVPALGSSGLMEAGALTLAVAMLGTTALWPNFYLESLFVEQKGWVDMSDIPTMRRDLIMGYTLGGIASIAIIVATASVLRPQGITSLETFITPGKALADILGDWAMVVFLGGTVVAAYNSIIPILWTPAYIIPEAWGERPKSSNPRLAGRNFKLIFAALCLVSGLSPLVNIFMGLSVLDMVVLFPAWNGVFGLPIAAGLLFWAVNDEETMGAETNDLKRNIVNFLLVALAIILALTSARGVVGAIFGGGL
jgi:Mn2+/Fe2+ NRAMP family transporter